MGNNAEYYEKDGKRFDRATTVLNYFKPPFLVKWMLKNQQKAFEEAIEKGLTDKKIQWGRITTKILEDSSGVGSRVGELIEQEWKEGSFKFKASDNYEVRNSMAAWADFKRDYQPEIIDMEVTEYDEGLGIAGTRDMRCRISGIVGILDLKTSKAIHLTYWLQTCFYRKAGEDERDQECWILRLDKETGMYEFESLTKAGFVYEECVKVLTGLVNVFRFFTIHDKEIAV